MTASDPRLVGSFPRADVPLDPALPEIAFLGRSNVGKSSLLNAVVGRRLARISATPGKTRTMNVFWVPGDYYFLDLPGYGYARASKAERTAFAHLVRHVLHRPHLAGVVWLLDARHEPSVTDRQMQDLLAASGAGVLAVVTKGDKVAQGQRAEREAALRQALSLDEDQMVLTSARTGMGIADLREAITALVVHG